MANCYGHSNGGANGRPTPEYKTWRNIIERCHDPKAKTYKRYGARGIIVCERWRLNYISFFEDMGLRPSPAHSIDRHPNAHGDYEPGNCRWATRDQQDRNRTDNRFVTIKGRRMIVTDAARKYGINRQTVCARLDAGWSIRRTFGL